MWHGDGYGRFQFSNHKMKKNDTLFRQWRMLREIPRFPRKIATSEIKNRLVAVGFNATLRTIQRDLIKLSTVLPLMADDAKPQGWSWQADAPQLDLPTLEPQAALVFHMAEKYLQPLLPASNLEYLSPWFRAATGVLDHHGNGLAAWRKKVRVLASGLPMYPPTIDAETQAIITQALLQDRRLELTYRPRDANGDRNYEVSLRGLVVRDHMIYLVCTLRDYSDIKQLAMNRILAVRFLDKEIAPLPDFDLDQYIAQGEFGFPVNSGRMLTLVAEFDRSAAAGFMERPLALDQIVEAIDESTVRLTAKVMDTQELRRWLLGFAATVSVTKPASLREEMKAMLEEMSQRYA